MKMSLKIAIALSLLTTVALVPAASAQETEGDPAVCAEGSVGSATGSGPIYHVAWQVGPQGESYFECWEETNGCEELQRTQADADEAGCEETDTLVFAVTVASPAV